MRQDLFVLGGESLLKHFAGCVLDALEGSDDLGLGSTVLREHGHIPTVRLRGCSDDYGACLAQFSPKDQSRRAGHRS